MTGFSARFRLELHPGWRSYAAFVAVVLWFGVLLWPVSVASEHHRATESARQSAVQAASEHRRVAWDDLMAAMAPVHPRSLWPRRPGRFSIHQLERAAERAPPPPYTEEFLRLARWCDELESPGHVCTRDGQELHKADAAVVMFAAEHGYVPRGPDRAEVHLAEEAYERAERALDRARQISEQPIRWPSDAQTSAVRAVAVTVLCFVGVLALLRRRWLLVVVDGLGLHVGERRIGHDVLGCAVVGPTVVVELAGRGALRLGPARAMAEELEQVAAAISTLVCTPQQRERDAAAQREIERRHAELRDRLRER